MEDLTLCPTCGSQRSAIQDGIAYFYCGHSAAFKDGLALSSCTARYAVPETAGTAKKISGATIKFVESQTGPRGIVEINGIRYGFSLTKEG